MRFLSIGALCLVTVAAVFGQAKFQSAATGNWNAAGTWTLVSGVDADGIPDADDSVEVIGSHTVTVNVASACYNLTITSGIVIVPGNNFTVSGTTTLNGELRFTSTLGTKSFQNVLINSGGYWNSAAAETYTIGGSVTMAGGKIDGAATGVLNVAGNFTVASGTDTLGRATVTVTGTTDINGTLRLTSITGTKNFQRVNINTGGVWTSTAAETYTIAGDLTMSGGTIDGTATGIFSVSGNYDILSGTNTLGQATITVTDTTHVDGTLNITSATGIKTFVGVVIIGSGGVWDNSTGNSAIVLRRGLTNDGSFTSGTGTYTFNTNSQALNGSSGLTFNGSVAITGAITITNNIAATIQGNLTGSVAGSTWLNAVNSTLNVAGALLPTGTLNATANPNLVEYSGTGAQTIKAANYYNLTISGARTTNSITLPNGGTVGVANSFTPSATFTTGGYIITGNTFNYNGTSLQTVEGFDYNNLTTSGASSKTLAASVTLAGNLSINAGTLDLDVFTADRTAAGGTLTVAAGTTLRIGGTNTLPANYTTYTLNAASTVEYYGSTQIIDARTYGNLTLSGSGPKTTPAGTTTTTVAGSFSLGAGITYEQASGATATLTLNGTTNSNNGVLGSVANPLATINVGNAVGDNLTNNGTLNLGTLAVTGSLTNNDTVTTTTALSGTGSLTQGTNSILYVGGTATITTLNATTNTPNLVEYNGTGVQTIKAANYSDLTISGARTTNDVTLPAATVGVSGTFSPTATFTSGTYVVIGNTFNYNGTGAQTIQAFKYNNLTVSGARTTNDVTWSTSDTIGVAGTLSLTATFTGAGTHVTTGSLVSYNGTGAQNVVATTATFQYFNLVLSTGSAKTAAGNLIVNGYLSIVGGASFNGGTSRTHNFYGNWIVNTTAAIPFAFTTTSVLNFNTPASPAPTLISGSTTATLAFNDVNINNTDGFDVNNNISFQTGTTPTLTVASGVVLAPDANVVLSGTTGTLTGNGTVKVTRIAATADFNSQYTIATKTLTNLTVDYSASGQVLSNLTYGNLTVSGSITGAGNTATVGNVFEVTGTFTPSSGTITMNNGASVLRSGGSLTFAGLTIANAATVTTSSSFDIGGALTVGAGATFSPSSDTITFNNGASISNSGSLTFSGISVANSAAVTTSSSFTIGGALTLGTGAMFTASAGTITMNGNSISGGGTLTFSGLTVGSALSASQDVAVNGVLTLNSDVSVGSNTLTMGGSATTAGTADVTGNVQRISFVTGTGYTFGNQFTSITFASGTLPSSIVVNIARGSTPAGKADAIQRSYDITATGGSGYSATLRLHYLDSELNGNTAADLALWKESGTWTDLGRTGSVNTTDNWVELAGLTSFSPWTLSNASLDNFAVSLTSPQLSGVAFTGTNTITAKDQNGNTITGFNASTNNVTVTANPNDGVISGLGSTANNVLNQSADFVNGVANMTGGLKFTGLIGDHTFTATSANGKTGVSGTIAINRATTNWSNTAVSSDWNDPANWTNGVPDSTKNVVISDSTPAPRIPLTNGRCFDLTVNNGGLLLWETSGGILYVHGNIVTTNGGGIDLGTYTPPNQIIFLSNATFNNGGTVNAGNGIIDLKGSTWQNNSGSTFDPGTSTVIVDGTGNQTFNGDITFYNLTVTNTTGSVSFSGDVVVNNDLTAAPGSDVQVTGGGSISVEGDLNGTISGSPRPFMTSAVAANTTQVDVTFNTPVDSTTAETTSNYSINSGTITVMGATRDVSNHAVVHLTVATLTAGIEDTLTVNNVQDTLGSAIAANSKKRFTLSASRVFYSRSSGNLSSANSWSIVSHTGAAASSAPLTAGDTVIIGNAHAITLDQNVSALGLVQVDTSGVLNTGTFVLDGSTEFRLNSGATLRIGSADGLSASGSTGNIQTATRIFSKSANYTYNGSSGQVTGSGLPDTVRSLTISNSGGSIVMLSSDVVVAGSLTMTQGTLDLAANNANAWASGGTLSLANGAALRIGWTNTFPSNYSTHAIDSASTVEYGGGNQTIAALNSGQSYGHLTLSGTGTKTLSAGVSVRGNLTVVPPAVLDAASGNPTFTFNGNGPQTIAVGTYNNLALSGSGTKTFASGTTLIAGSLAISGTATVDATTNSTTIEYNGGSAQSVTAIDYSSLTLSGSGIKTFASGTTGVAGTFTISGSATGDAAANSSTIDYNGSGVQPVTKFDYFNLSLSNAGVKTLADTVRIAGNFIVSGSASANAPTNTLVIYNGTTAQSVAGITYWDVEFINSGVKSISVSTMVVNNAMIIRAGAQVVITSTGIVQFTGDLINDGVFINDGTITAN